VFCGGFGSTDRRSGGRCGVLKWPFQGGACHGADKDVRKNRRQIDPIYERVVGGREGGRGEYGKDAESHPHMSDLCGIRQKKNEWKPTKEQHLPALLVN